MWKVRYRVWNDYSAEEGGGADIDRWARQGGGGGGGPDHGTIVAMVTNAEPIDAPLSWKCQQERSSELVLHHFSLMSIPQNFNYSCSSSMHRR